MTRCSVCSAPNDRRTVYFNRKLNKYLCEKHYQQYRNHGRFLDSNERTINDLNEIILHSSCAEIILYDKYSNPINSTLIDLEDVDKCCLYKWRLNRKGKLNPKYYVYAGQRQKQAILHRLVMNCNDPNLEIDHIDSDTLDNRKKNLRVVSHSDNTKNVSIRVNANVRFKGVTYDEKYGVYKVDAQYNNERYYYKTFQTLAEAVYLKYLSEIHLYPELRNRNNDRAIFKQIETLSTAQQEAIEKYFYSKHNEILRK